MTEDLLAELEAKERIREVLARYCRGIDRCDAELVRSTYHLDSTDNHGLYNGSGYEFADFIVPLLREHYEATSHCLHNSLIELDGDTAFVETYAATHDIQRRPDGVRWYTQVGCRYADHFERRDGQWKIDHRVVLLDWHHGHEAPESGGLAEAAGGFVHGRRDAADLTYTQALTA